jgi:uncharacterized glyoxalase superfamily protein PhnB
MLKLAVPLLHVSNAEIAEDFYCRRLGFRRRFSYRVDESRADPCFMGVERDGVMLHVSSFPGDGVPGAATGLIVDEVDSLHAEFVGRGVAIAMPPTDQTWGNREMYVRDPDGNALRFIQEGAAAG